VQPDTDVCGIKKKKEKEKKRKAEKGKREKRAREGKTHKSFSMAGIGCSFHVPEYEPVHRILGRLTYI
jgi:hypothetical protein